MASSDDIEGTFELRTHAWQKAKAVFQSGEGAGESRKIASRRAHEAHHVIATAHWVPVAKILAKPLNNSISADVMHTTVQLLRRRVQTGSTPPADNAVEIKTQRYYYHRQDTKMQEET